MQKKLLSYIFIMKYLIVQIIEAMVINKDLCLHFAYPRARAAFMVLKADRIQLSMSERICGVDGAL